LEKLLRVLFAERLPGGCYLLGCLLFTGFFFSFGFFGFGAALGSYLFAAFFLVFFCCHLFSRVCFHHQLVC
jgi:hypothetical protein